jgi:hypothetical protein
MTYDEKLSIIISALREAQKATRKKYYTHLYLTENNRLTKIDPNELHNILLKLQDDEKVINVKDIPTKLKPVLKQTEDMLYGEKIYFLINILDSFDDWYENYLMKQKTELANLDYINLLRIYDIVLDINEQIQLTNKVSVSIHLLPPPGSF